LVASKPGFEVLTKNGEWVDAFILYDFVLPPHCVLPFSKREVVVELSRLVPIDEIVPLSLLDMSLPASGVRLPITARVKLSIKVGDEGEVVRSDPFVIREADVIAARGTSDATPPLPTNMVAFGIRNSAGSWDYCVIAGNGLMRCRSFLEDDSKVEPDAEGYRDYWFNYSYHLPDSDMERLRQLLGEEKVLGSAEEYNGNNAEGKRRYLAIYSEDGPRVMYFDLPLPPSVAPLISCLEELREEATGELSRVSDSSDIGQRDPL
jgi:hypothetical protein